jgi:hypothetical protein
VCRLPTQRGQQHTYLSGRSVRVVVGRRQDRPSDPSKARGPHTTHDALCLPLGSMPCAMRHESKKKQEGRRRKKQEGMAAGVSHLHATQDTKDIMGYCLLSKIVPEQSLARWLGPCLGRLLACQPTYGSTNVRQLIVSDRAVTIILPACMLAPFRAGVASSSSSSSLVCEKLRKIAS